MQEFLALSAVAVLVVLILIKAYNFFKGDDL
jgi:hypothetical protein